MTANLFARPPGENAPRILVVDDDRRVLELLDLALSTHGFRVLTAADGEEALKQALGQRPDLVVLDVRLPRKSGLDVCEALRRDPEECTVPIILVSAAIETETRLQGFARGADDYLSKPFSPKELIARVRRLLARSGEAREARRRALELERELTRAQEDARRGHLEIRREQRLRDLAFGLGREFHRTLDLDELAERILLAAQARLGVGTAVLLLPDDAGALLVPRAVRGDGPDRVAGLALASGGEMATLLEGLARPVLRRDLERFPELRAELPALIASGMALLAPLRGPDRLEAVLVTDERVDGAELPALELELLAGLCEIAAAALANAQIVRAQTDRALEAIAALRTVDRSGREHRAEGADIAERAAHAIRLPLRERELLMFALRLDAPVRDARGTRAARALASLEAADPSGRVAGLKRLIERAHTLREPVAEQLIGDPAVEDADSAPARAAMLLAVALGHAAERAAGLDPEAALERAMGRVAGLDPVSRAALIAALRERSLAAGHAA